MRSSAAGSPGSTSARRVELALASPPRSARRKAVCNSGSGSIGHPRTGDALGGARFPDKSFEWRQVFVPFDEAGHETESVERLLIELPDRFGNDRGVVVDQNLRAAAHDARMPREMDFANE